MRICLPYITAVLLLADPGAAPAATHVVNPGESIQAAVDAARPGDTILVNAGVYAPTPGAHSVVHVTTDDLTLTASLGAVIDAADAPYGILVGPDLPRHRSGCPAAPSISQFRLRGFTFSNAASAGVRLAAVEHYRVSHGFYVENGEHGVSVACSRHGRIDHSFASGHRAASIHAEDSDTLRVDHNILKHSGLGVEIGNSLNGVVRDNWITNNSVGVAVIAHPGRALPFVENVSIEHNWIVENNRADANSALPVGSGVLNLGGDDVTIRANTLIGNASFGIASFGNPFGDFDPRLESFVDGLVVKRNIAKRNGQAPDTRRLATPPADVIFVPDVLDGRAGIVIETDPDPTDNCFTGNHIDTDVPGGVTQRLACP